MASIDAWQAELAGVVGAENAGESSAEIEGVKPACVVAPASAEETAATLRIANEHGLCVVPAGGLTKQGMGHVMTQIDVLLSTRRMNQVQYYDPGDLTFGVGAGMTLAEVQQTLTAHGQWLPFDAMSSSKGSVGGLMATNAHGPLKHFYGGVRDFCIGVEFATADGKVAKGGGRVVKNVAGYDLMKLLIGSLGTLGVITSANFKVFPRPQQTRTFVGDFSSLPEAMAFRDAVMKSSLTPLCVEIASPGAQEYFGEVPAARNPDLYAPKAHLEPRREWCVYVRAAGSDRVLERYRAELSAARELGGAEEAALWQWISGFESSVLARHHNAMIVYIDVPVTDVAAAIAAAEKAALDNSCMAAVVGRVAAGALVAAIIPLAVGPPSAMHYANAASALRAALPKDASAVVARCPLEAKSRFDVWGTSPTDVGVMQAVRAAMDPKGILNRGRFV
ncbi:MAG: FAD-binding oxidoreductase [Terriglobales bacterium]